MKKRPAVFAICQPNALGDVVSCLPMACAIKRELPGSTVYFIGRPYSRPLIETSIWIDHYLDAEEMLAHPSMLVEQGIEVFLNPYLQAKFGNAARRGGVPIRVGKLHPKTFAWANRFVVQNTGRVQRHRALLNLHYLRPLGIRSEHSLDTVGTMLGLKRRATLLPGLRAQLDPSRFNLVLHPKSNGSGREWPAQYFDRLVALLPPERVKVFVTGRPSEREKLLAEQALLGRSDITDLTGQLDLAQLIAFYQAADGLVSSGTGPLHIAAGLGIHALGLFPGRDRITAARWHPLGPKGESLSLRTVCRPSPGNCPRKYTDEACACMVGIQPQEVAQRVLRWLA